jgi:biotin-[acetyl-CoA-carboxylase] ligase BirA-like protein
MRNDYQMGYDCARRGQVYTSSGLTVLPSTTSTMDEIERLIPYPQDKGHTVIALHQTHGKGSQDRKWESLSGNLLFSLKLWIQPHEYAQEMEIIAACAVKEVLQDLLPSADIVLKHPNDVLIGGQKICGCLAYPKYDAEDKIGKLRAINLGVGVNLATAPQDKTCLAQHGENIGIVAFMEKFDSAFNAILAEYRSSKDFNTVLRRAGFLPSDSDILILYGNDNRISYTGYYAGFVSRKDVNHLKLRDGSLHPLRSFDLRYHAQRPKAQAGPAATIRNPENA